ncbi:hypothetical protein CLHUN_14580 [Ruminiclostridium hungatei]|uniref:Ribbon-helix-helix protein CopG domain-containing protein n=1 Tax=Ruminiclostridium hungatei TaxID=48256 RepID=A0A1V4SLV5_RUMHU|nr:hypothetical protein [Ruminiclostridium hungatei]OPX44465.1 hypothetical protein CLHUN_14580 [Ruminiclostridium hungatei]
MEAKRTSEDKNKRSIRFEAGTMKELKKFAGRTNVTVSDIVREYVKKGLTIDSYKEDTHLIREIVREELKDALEPQVNRIVKMLMKIGKVSAGTMYSTLNLIQTISNQEQQEDFEMVSRCLKLGVECMKKKDIEIDNYLGEVTNLIKDNYKMKW